MTRTFGRVLVVLDFDWSLVEENSDTWVLQQLGASHIFQRLLSEGVPWTQLVDTALLAAYTELKATQKDVLKAIRSTPFHPEMVQVVHKMAATVGCAIVILSDANTIFINEILEHHHLTQYIHKVYSNEATWQDGALRVRPFHGSDPPHACSLCPPNLCKGQVLDELMAEADYERVMYLGDGSGDFCPCTKLRPCDYAVAREFYPTGKECPLFRKACMSGALVADCFESASSSGCEDVEPAAAVGRSELEVASGSASQLDDLRSQGGVEQFSGASLAQGTGRGLKAMSEWSLEEQSRAGSEHGIAATVCPWQTASEAAALLLALVKPTTG